MPTSNQKAPAFSKFFKVLDEIIKLPRRWLIMTITIAVLSAFQVTHTNKNGLQIDFHVTPTTALLIAAMWIPTFLRLIAVMGGGVKVAGAEMTTGGNAELLLKIIATLDTVEAKLPEDEREHIKELRENAETELSILPIDSKEARQNGERLAKEYEDIRRSMGPGYDRTVKMNAVLAYIRALSSKANYTCDELREKFDTGKDGQRILVIGMIRGTNKAECLDIIMSAITEPRTPFEEYQALRTLKNIIYLLSEDKRRYVGEKLKGELERPGNKIIKGDASSYKLAQEIIDMVRGK